MWSRTTEALPGKDYSDERYVGHFYRHGLVWMLDHNSPRTPEGQNLWVALKPETGEVVRELTTQGEWPRTATPAKMGCQLLIASDRFIMIPRQATYIDMESGEKLSFKFVRGGCGLGFVPANGLVYSHPHACGCFSEAVRGFIGMHSDANVGSLSADDERQQTVATMELRADEASANDWPMHRHDGARTAATQAAISPNITWLWSQPLASRISSVSKNAWRLRTGNELTAPTIMGDHVYAADVDQGRLYAVNRQSGNVDWTFTANGRVDSPPTLYRGLCLFGSHDGYVYGLEASTGRLLWKFRAAPVDRRIVAFGNLESNWPVAGSVLILDQRAYVAAGRSPDADGGIEIHALQPATGELVWSTRVTDEAFRGLSDFMVSDGKAVYLANWQFDPLTGKNGVAPEQAPHLQGGKVGLLEASWTKHDLALRKNIQTWTAQGAEGQLLAFSGERTVSYLAEKQSVTTASSQRQTESAVPAPQQVTALAMTPNHLVIAGGKDRADRLAGGFLKLVDLQTGNVVKEIDLPAEPAFDGVAIGHGQILVSTQDGQLHAFGAN